MLGTWTFEIENYFTAAPNVRFRRRLNNGHRDAVIDGLVGR